MTFQCACPILFLHIASFLGFNDPRVLSCNQLILNTNSFAYDFYEWDFTTHR